MDPHEAIAAPTLREAIVLASGSPRRRELLARAGLEFRVVAADIPEERVQGEAPDAFCIRLAEEKASAVAARLSDGSERLVLGADTIVVRDASVLGKPDHDAHAIEMLRSLMGRTHEVWTGAAVVERHSGRAWTLAVRSQVTMREATEAELRAYVATGEPHDKAGAYAIQGGARQFITALEGSETNVIGLPVEETLALLQRASVEAGT